VWQTLFTDYDGKKRRAVFIAMKSYFKFPSQILHINSKNKMTDMPAKEANILTVE